MYNNVISYWAKLKSGNENKIVNILYKYLYTQFSNGTINNPWFAFINRILNISGLSNIWREQGIANEKWITNAVKQSLRDQFIQTWSSDIFNSSKGTIYRIFKTIFCLETHLEILPVKLRSLFLKFRTTNHRLPVETGRWFSIPYNERFCVLCNDNKIADEYHFLLECSALSTIRKEFLQQKYCSRPNTVKFDEIMSTSNIKTLKKLCIFISKIYEKVCSP